MQIDGISAIAIILIASFAIDRIATGLLFLLSMSKRWGRRFPDPATITDKVEQHIASKKQKILYYCIAGFLAIGVLAGYGGIRIFTALGFNGAYPYFGVLDALVTGLVMVAGADRIAGFMGVAGGQSSQASTSQPLEISGRLIVEDDSRNSATGVPAEKASRAKETIA